MCAQILDEALHVMSYDFLQLGFSFGGGSAERGKKAQL